MRHPNSKVNLLDGNHFYEDIVDAGRLARLTFKLDLIINEKKEVIRAFAGDPVAEHREASQYAAPLYLIDLPKLADVTIVSAFPLEWGFRHPRLWTWRPSAHDQEERLSGLPRKKKQAL